MLDNPCSEIPIYPFPREIACDYVKAHYAKCGDTDIQIDINSVGYISSLGTGKYYGYHISYFWNKGNRSGNGNLNVEDLERVEQFIREQKSSIK